MNLWQVIKLHYKYQFDIPLHVVDYIAVRPILIKSLSGYSNTRIAIYTQESIEYISDILFRYLGFSGWSLDLDFNPIANYNKVKGNFILYKQEISMISSISNVRLINKTYFLCKIFYDKIQGDIDKYYDRTT